jgi:hypothetical protein
LEKGKFFVGTDRYLFYDFEEAMFFADHRNDKVYMKFIGNDFESEVGDDHRIFNDAILSGIEITKAEYEAGEITVSRSKLDS